MEEITPAMRKALVVVSENKEPLFTGDVAAKLYPSHGVRGRGQRVGNASKLLYRLSRVGLVKCYPRLPTDRWSITDAGANYLILVL